MMINKDNFKQEVEDSADLVLVDFFAPWCGPCQMMTPIIEEMIDEYKGQQVKIVKLNIDETPEVAMKYNVMSVPTFLLFQKGKVIGRIVGYCTKEELVELLNKV